MYQYKACRDSRIQIKAEGGTGHGSISGYVAAFGDPERAEDYDLEGEIFSKGAFSEHVPEFVKRGFVTIEHEWKRLPIATIREAREDKYGLFIDADFHSIPEAQNARTVASERLERGKDVSFSVGHLTRHADREHHANGIILRKSKPLEASLANVPINQLAAVTGVKSLDLQAGLTMDDHQDEALATLSGFVRRAQGLVELREKSGRKIAEARRQRIRAAIEAFLSGARDLEELLKETEHQEADPEEADPEVVKKSITAFLIEDARRKEMLRHGPLART